MVIRTGAATGTVPAPPAAVFDAITDIDRLPQWNKTIQRVVERPDAPTEGAEWVVAVRPPGMPEWLSRSKTVEHDAVGHRFRYRTCFEHSVIDVGEVRRVAPFDGPRVQHLKVGQVEPGLIHLREQAMESDQIVDPRHLGATIDQERLERLLGSQMRVEPGDANPRPRRGPRPPLLLGALRSAPTANATRCRPQAAGRSCATRPSRAGQ